jgi:hypothetical protein
MGKNIEYIKRIDDICHINFSKYNTFLVYEKSKVISTKTTQAIDKKMQNAECRI